jgi:ferredoxin
VWVRNWVAFGVAVIWLVGLAVLAWWKGRVYCNAICPVGTFLGLVSKVSVFAPGIDKAKCTACGVCEKRCKSECIDSKSMTIDRSRCVVCFDCVDSCKFGAIRYSACKPKAGALPSTQSEGTPPSQGGESRVRANKGVNRRQFFSIAALAAAATPAALKAQQVERILLQVDGGLADIEDKIRPERKTPITPPGSEDARNMKQHCTACQLCVAACPNNVIVPSSRLATLMQPEMTFEHGYCRPECVECGAVCPTGAIKRFTAADKTAISVGNAVYHRHDCVVRRDGVPCTECERHCPTKAITLVPLNAEEAAKEAAPAPRWGPKPAVLKIPVVDTTLCIGCGACEHLCPARPHSAIHVEGNSTHHSV